jgi:hypothetical protein
MIETGCLSLRTCNYWIIGTNSEKQSTRGIEPSGPYRYHAGGYLNLYLLAYC